MKNNDFIMSQICSNFESNDPIGSLDSELEENEFREKSIMIPLTVYETDISVDHFTKVNRLKILIYRNFSLALFEKQCTNQANILHMTQ